MPLWEYTVVSCLPGGLRHRSCVTLNSAQDQLSSLRLQPPTSEHDYLALLSSEGVLLEKWEADGSIWRKVELPRVFEDLEAGTTYPSSSESTDENPYPVRPPD